MSFFSFSSRRRSANLAAAVLLLTCTVLLIWQRDAAFGGASDSKETSAKRQERAKFAQARSCELDRKFFPLSSQTRIGSKCQRQDDDELEDLTATLVMGRLDEDVDKVAWVDELKGIHDYHIYVVDNPESPLVHLDQNHGREAAVYLKYIVENYDNLNNVTFFWHSDRIVWHNNMMLNWDSVESINHMNRKNIMRKGYVPARCESWPGCPSWIKFNPSRAEFRLDPHRMEDMFTPDFLGRLFANETNFPPYFAGTCCSQFAVSDEQIRSRPVEAYQRILDWILEYEDDEKSGRVMEYIWPYIFLKQGTLCPSMQNCYCQTYDFCMEDQEDIEKLVTWNDLRARREEVQWQVNFVSETMKLKTDELLSQGYTDAQVEEALSGFKPEFERLTLELDKLSQRTWEEREVIIHRWRLDVPPVGW